MSLGTWPAPVRRLDLHLPRGVSLYLKDEGRVSPIYGGNKVRKLERALAAAAETDAPVVTGGAAGSHHALATALHARHLGLRVHLVLCPQPDTPDARAHLARTAGAATRVVTTPTGRSLAPAIQQVADGLAQRGTAPPVVLPLGGSCAAGVAGSVDLGLELAQDIHAGRLPQPSQVFLAAGSGGTAAGVWMGLRLGGIESEVVAVRVAPRRLVASDRLLHLAGKAAEWLALPAASVPRSAEGLRIDHSQVGAGYATPSTDARAAAAEVRPHGLELEETYTGRALAACLAAVREGRTGPDVVFVQTASQAPLPPAGPVPPRLASLLRAGATR